MKIAKLGFCAFLALAICPAFSNDRPNTSDLIFTGKAAAPAAAAASPSVDLEKIDYLLLSEKRDKPFDQLHTHVMSAFEAEGKAGKSSAVEAAAELAGLKASADKAYEEFLAALTELKTLTALDVLSAGTSGLADAVATLSGDAATRAAAVEGRAAGSAVRVLELRALYRQRANTAAGQLLASR